MVFLRSDESTDSHYERYWELIQKEDSGTIKEDEKSELEELNKKYNPYLKKNKGELWKSKKTFENLIQEHLEKIDQYKCGPDKCDNEGRLKGASPEIREKIISGGIKALEKQVRKQQRELEKVNKALNEN